MFTPKLNAPRRSSFTTHAASNRDRRSVGIFTPPARGNSSRLSGIHNGRYMQASQIVEETAQHVLEVYGSSLPVLVTETLALIDKQSNLSVKLGLNGWAWLVCGRRLFVWRFKQSSSGRSGLCQELLLPPSELCHSASLVTLLHTGQQVGCIASSPEGVIRYWPSVAHESAFVEVSTELSGEESSILIDLPHAPGICVLGTTCASVVLIMTGGPAQLSYRSCRVPHGMLSGVGRRMSTFLWGSGTSLLSETTLKQVVAGEKLENGSATFYVLTGSNIQKWAILGNQEKFLYEFDVEKQIKEHVAQAVWGQEASAIPSLSTWLLDISLAGDGLVVLGACNNPDISPSVHYVLGTLHIAGQESPRSFLNFTVTRFTQSLQQADAAVISGYKLLLPDPGITSVYLYDEKAVQCLSVTSSIQPYDTVEFQSPGDKLLGAGSYGGQALFFSSLHGLVTIHQLTSESGTDASVNESVTSFSESHMHSELSMLAQTDISKIEEMSLSEDKTSQLKAACLYHIKGNSKEAEQILDDLLPSSNLDELVSQLSTEMIDAYPSPDPRWAEVAESDGTHVSSSLLLQHQLEDKLKCYELFMTFLKAFNIPTRLANVKIHGEEMPTSQLLRENAEKVFAAMTLRTHHTDNPTLIDQAIKNVLEMRGECVPHTGLTPQDIFYRQVSRIHEIIIVLHDMELHAISSGQLPRALVALIRSVNSTVMGMLHDAWQYRQSKSAIYSVAGSINNEECLHTAWTASTGPKGMHTILLAQHALTLQTAVPAAASADERRQLMQQLLELTDLILEGHCVSVEAARAAGLKDSAQYAEMLTRYERDRKNLILPFLDNDQPERAASLAEKYCEFSILVQLCEETNNYDRLQRYMSQFQNKGFSDFVFQWYVKQGKRGKLLSSSLVTHPQLGAFLASVDNRFMSWMHDFNVADFSKAHDTLYNLGEQEQKHLAKKKTLLSLSKLAALASDHSPAEPKLAARLENINNSLDLILNQETLPEQVLDSLGLDPNNMHVMAPKELIEHYVSDYDHGANEYDFKKALDLMQYINRPDNADDYDELLVHIWCQAILRDNWTDISSENPLENAKDTIFFKTVELAYTEGLNLRDYLPSADNLLASKQLSELSTQNDFQYLVRAGYEQIQRILA